MALHRSGQADAEWFRRERRSRFSSAVESPIQRTNVDSPIPRSSAISRCVRPLVCASRTASSANSGVNLCFVIEFTFHLRKTLHSFEASPISFRLLYGLLVLRH